MTAGDGLGEIQRLLSEDFGSQTGRGTPESVVVVFLGLLVAGAVGCAIGYYGPGVQAGHSINLAVPYAALAIALYVLSVAAGPVHVAERLLASGVTFAWLYAMTLDGHVVHRTVDANAILSTLVPIAFLAVALAHVCWRSGFLEGLRRPRDLYPRTRNLALIYAPTIYLAAWDVVTAL